MAAPTAASTSADHQPPRSTYPHRHVGRVVDLSRRARRHRGPTRHRNGLAGAPKPAAPAPRPGPCTRTRTGRSSRSGRPDPTPPPGRGQGRCASLRDRLRRPLTPPGRRGPASTAPPGTPAGPARREPLPSAVIHAESPDSTRPAMRHDTVPTGRRAPQSSCCTPTRPAVQPGHFVGCAVDVDAHLTQLRAGGGPPLIRGAVAPVVDLELACTWPASRSSTQKLGNHTVGPRSCRICQITSGLPAE